MQTQDKTALRWYAGLIALVLACMAPLSVLPHPKTVAAQTSPNIAWPNPPYTPVNVNCSTSPCTLISAPSAGAVCVYGLSLTNAGGTNVTLNAYLDGGTTAVASAFLLANGGNANWPLRDAINPKNPYFLTNLTTAFVVTMSSNVQLNGSVYAATCP